MLSLPLGLFNFTANGFLYYGSLSVDCIWTKAKYIYDFDGFSAYIHLHIFIYYATSYFDRCNCSTTYNIRVYVQAISWKTSPLIKIY